MAKPILKRLKRPRSSTPKAADQHYGFAAELPGLRAGHPLWRISIEWSDRAEGNGERLRLKAHMQTAVGEALAVAGQAGDEVLQLGHADAAASRLAALGRRVGGAVASGLRQPLVQRMLEPLRAYELNTWLDMQLSTAALDAGATALLPAPEQLARLGIAPSPANRAPIVESWATPGAVQSSFAQVSLLRLGKEQLPLLARALLGTRPFHLAAAIVNVVEPSAAPHKKARTA